MYLHIYMWIFTAPSDELADLHMDTYSSIGH